MTTMAGGFRIKVDLTQLEGSDRRISWFFVGGDCADVGQLKAAVFARFRLPKDNLNTVELWLDDCVIPDCEPISLLKGNDYIAFRSVLTPVGQVVPSKLPVTESLKGSCNEVTAEPTETDVIISDVVTVSDSYENNCEKSMGAVETADAPQIETVELEDSLLERNENCQESAAEADEFVIDDDDDGNGDDGNDIDDDDDGGIVAPAEQEVAVDSEEPTKVVVDVEAEAEAEATATDNVDEYADDDDDDGIIGFEPQEEYYIVSSVETIDDAECGDSNSSNGRESVVEADAEHGQTGPDFLEEVSSDDQLHFVKDDVLETISDDDDGDVEGVTTAAETATVTSNVTATVQDQTKNEPTIELDGEDVVDYARRCRAQSNYWVRRRDFLKKIQITIRQCKPAAIEGNVEVTMGNAEVIKSDGEVTKSDAEVTKSDAEVTKSDAEVTKGNTEVTIDSEVSKEGEPDKADSRTEVVTDVHQVVSSEGEESNVPTETVLKLVEIVASREEQQDGEQQEEPRVTGTQKISAKSQDLEDSGSEDLVVVAQTRNDESDDDIIEVVVIKKSAPLVSESIEPVIVNTIEHILLADNADPEPVPDVTIKTETEAETTVPTSNEATVATSTMNKSTATVAAGNKSTVSPAPALYKALVAKPIVTAVTVEDQQKLSKKKRKRLRRAAAAGAATPSSSATTTSQSSGNPITVLSSRAGASSEPLTSAAAMTVFGPVVGPQMDMHYPLYDAPAPLMSLLPLPTAHRYHDRVAHPLPVPVPQSIVGSAPYMVRYPMPHFAMSPQEPLHQHVQQPPLAGMMPYCFKPQPEHRQAPFVRTMFHVAQPRPVPSATSVPASVLASAPRPVRVPRQVPVPHVLPALVPVRTSRPVPVYRPESVVRPVPAPVFAPAPAPVESNASYVSSFADADDKGFWLSSDMIEHRVGVTSAAPSRAISSTATSQLPVAATKTTYSYTPEGWCRRSPSKVTAAVLDQASARTTATTATARVAVPVKSQATATATAAPKPSKDVKCGNKRSGTTSNRTGSSVKRRSSPGEYEDRRKIVSTGSGTRRNSPALRDARRKSASRHRSTSTDRRKASPAARRRRTPVPSRQQVSPSLRRRSVEAKRRAAKSRTTSSRRSSPDCRGGRDRRRRSRSRCRSRSASGRRKRRLSSSSSSNKSDGRRYRSPPPPPKTRRSRTISVSSVTDDDDDDDEVCDNVKGILECWSRRITLGTSTAAHNQDTPLSVATVSGHRHRHRSQLDLISISSGGGNSQEPASFRAVHEPQPQPLASSQPAGILRSFRRERLDSISSTSTLNATGHMSDYGPLDSISSKSDLEFDGGEGRHRHRRYGRYSSPLPGQQFQFDEGENESGYNWYAYEVDGDGRSADMEYDPNDDIDGDDNNENDGDDGFGDERYYSPESSGRAYDNDHEYYVGGNEEPSVDRGHLQDGNKRYPEDDLSYTLSSPPPRDEFLMGGNDDGGYEQDIDYEEDNNYPGDNSYAEDSDYPMDEYASKAARYNDVDDDDEEVMFAGSYETENQGYRPGERVDEFGATDSSQPFANFQPSSSGAGRAMRGTSQASRAKFSYVRRPDANVTNVRKKNNNMRSAQRLQDDSSRKQGTGTSATSTKRGEQQQRQQQRQQRRQQHEQRQQQPPLRSILKTVKDSAAPDVIPDARIRKSAPMSTGGAADPEKNMANVARACAAVSGYGSVTDNRTTVAAGSHTSDNYSSYPILEGAPRVDDIIAYKEFETDESGAFVDTEYKVGKVLEYNSYCKEVILEFPVNLTGTTSGHKGDTEEFREEVAMDMTCFAEVRLISHARQ